MSYYYIAEAFDQENGKKRVEIRNEITKDEFDKIINLFGITGTCHCIDEIKDIVVENGREFKAWMNPSNLQHYRSRGTNSEKLLLISNKLVLNYASSIKTFIDIATRLIKQKKPEKKEEFHSLTSKFYDNYMEYRFWVNFRNYIVHCAMPYTQFNEAIGKPCKIICTKEHLLKFDNWKHSRVDIEKLPDEINLTEMIDEMSSLICALYLDFYYIFAKDITDATNKYADYCKKYDCKNIVLFTSEAPQEIKGEQLHPLPLDSLYKAVKILQEHPNVNLNITHM